MKKILALLLTLAMLFSLAACGGGGEDEKTPSSGDNPPSSSQQQEQQEDKPPEADEPEDNGGEDEPDDKGGTDADGWPVADYITAGMKYTGAGKIVNASTWSRNGYDCWRVYIDAASVDEVAAYIDALKADGFTHSPNIFYPEEKAAGEFDSSGEYQWEGVASDGRFVSFIHTQEPTDFSGTDLAQLEIHLYSKDPDA